MTHSQPEFRMQVAVSDYLERFAAAEVAWNIFPAGEKRTLATGARLKRAGLRPGWGDYIMLVAGKAVMLELKTDSGRQSDSQKETERLWVQAGGVYYLARSFDQAIGFLDIIGALKPTHPLRKAA